MKKLFKINELTKKLKNAQRLGIGAFSQTYLINKNTKEFYAVKVIAKINNDSI